MSSTSVQEESAGKPGDFLQVKGEVVQIDVIGARFNDTQAGRLLTEIVRCGNKIRGVHVHASLIEGTMSIIPQFGHSSKNEARRIMEKFIKEITRIFKCHYTRARRSKQGLITAAA